MINKLLFLFLATFFVIQTTVIQNSEMNQSIQEFYDKIKKANFMPVEIDVTHAIVVKYIIKALDIYLFENPGENLPFVTEVTNGTGTSISEGFYFKINLKIGTSNCSRTMTSIHRCS